MHATSPQALSEHLHLLNKCTRSLDPAIKRTFDTSSIPGILRIVYSFEGPEEQVKTEQRIIEMTPNFAAKCYSTLMTSKSAGFSLLELLVGMVIVSISLSAAISVLCTGTCVKER